MKMLIKTGLQLLAGFTLAFILLGSDVAAQQTPFGITYAVNYRDSRGYWNPVIRDARRVLDQMVINKGPDNTLAKFNWDQLEETASWAAAFLKNNNELEFADRMRSIERSMIRLTTREAELIRLRAKVKSELETSTAKWDELIAGSGIEEKILIALGKKGAGTAMSAALHLLGDKIANNIASKFVTGVGKAVGPISLLFSGMDVYLAAAEWGDLRILMPRLLEMTETVAYLDVLLKQYDGAINAHEEIIDTLLIDKNNGCEKPKTTDGDNEQGTVSIVGRSPSGDIQARGAAEVESSKNPVGLSLSVFDALDRPRNTHVNIKRNGKGVLGTWTEYSPFDLPPGTYEIQFDYALGIQREVVITAGQITPVVVRGVAGRLSLSVFDALGQPRNTHVNIKRNGKGVLGTWTEYSPFDLPPGTYEVQFDIGEGFTKSAIVVAGEPAKIEVVVGTK